MVKTAGLAWLDVSSGRFLITEVDDEAAVHAEIARLAPAEVLLPESSALPHGTWGPPYAHSPIGSLTRPVPVKIFSVNFKRKTSTVSDAGSSPPPFRQQARCSPT